MTRSLCQEVTKNWHSIPSNRTTACSGSNVSVDLGIVSLILGNSGLPVAYKIPGKAERLGKLGLADAAILPPGADDLSIHLLVERMEFLFLMTGKTDDIVFPVRIL